MSWRAPRTRARTLATVLLLTVAAAEVTFNLKICPDSSCSVG